MNASSPVGPSEESRRPRQENQAEWYVDERDVQDAPGPFCDERENEHASEREYAGRGPRGVQPDERIRAGICKGLALDPAVDGGTIEVGVAEAEVTLSGTVNSVWEKQRAEALAQVRGVRDVHNRLRIPGETK